MLDMKIFPKRLKAARLSAGLSQSAAADAAGINRPIVSYAESGKTIPAVHNVVALAQVYGVSVDWLFGKDVGETVTFFDNERQLQALTGLDHKGLWDAGFDLDDWDYGFVTMDEWPDPESLWSTANPFYQWQLLAMLTNVCTVEHVEYQGRHYYMRYHA